MAGPLHGRLIKPMKAASGELPVGDDWVYELKWDGMRNVAFIDDDGLRLQTTNLLDSTVSFPELQAMAGAFDGFESVILDGEIVAFGSNGQPSFGAMQDRMHVKDPVDARRRATRNPVHFIVFDLLHLNGIDMFEVPFGERRRLLDEVLDSGDNWQVSTCHRDDAAALLDTVIDRGMEGLVAKRLSSRYVEGKRAPTWRKIKPRGRQEFVVGGWSEGRDGRSGTVGSLLIGVFEDEDFVHVGSVGSGLDSQSLAAWMDLVTQDARVDSPFVNEVAKMGRELHWVEPRHVIEVAFGEWTDDGHLRHPSYLGRRTDKDPTEVTRHP